MHKTEIEYAGIFVTEQEMANMKMEHIHVPDFAIVQILKNIQLTKEAQDEVVLNLVERNHFFFRLEEKERLEKMKIALTQETVVEYLRLNEMIREEADMLEVGIDEEGTIVVTVYYIDKHEEIDKAFQNPSIEDVQRMEREINILDGRLDLVQEAKKRLEQRKGQVIPMNRAARRKAAKAK